jgi:hypothetical protein
VASERLALWTALVQLQSTAVELERLEALLAGESGLNAEGELLCCFLLPCEWQASVTILAHHCRAKRVDL